MRVIIAGGRDFSDYELMSKSLKCLIGKDVTIISGRAKGADRLGETYGEEHSIPIERYPADWEKNGKSAGYLRNLQMLDNATHVIAFWDGKSKGTLHLLREAKKRNMPIKLVKY
jgi:hypothetical protein